MAVWATWAIWIALIVAAYLLGSVPSAYLAAKSSGVDLRRDGTNQVGGGNLWRMTSWKLGLPVAIFDACKGLAMVWVAQAQGLDTGPQIAVGLAAIVGHNWPVFLRFHGGRGIGTTIGIFLILPLINDMTPWPSVAFLALLIIGSFVLRTSPLAALAGVIAAPILSWAFHEPLSVTLGFLAIFLVIVIKRLTAQSSAKKASISTGRLLLNRFLFDRDIRDRKAWMSRKPITPQDIEDILED